MSTSAIPIHMAKTYTKVKVNVRLCGSIPRVDLSSLMKHQHDSHPEIPSSSSNQYNEEDCVAQKLCSHLYTMQHQQQQQQEEQAQHKLIQPQHMFYSEEGISPPSSRRQSPTYEAPSWAVPASGEARLEPVCDSVDRQGPVDLTSQSVFRVGRSPQSDVQLMHVTSSRRHAMLFHHSNGSCYLVDCGSAHGTYINGIRVTSAPNEGNVVVPTRVRRGSMVRFGGPGAPSFVLKSFSFDLDEMRDCPVPSISLRPTTRLPSTPLLTAMVEHNTRLNSLGRTAQQELMVHHQISTKRSYDSLETVMDSDDDGDEHMEEDNSRISLSHHHQSPLEHLSSPPLSPEQSQIRLVSPDMNCVCDPSGFKRRRVTFSEENLLAASAYPILVSPDVSSDEQDIECCNE